MLISGEQVKLENGCFKLASWLRAPLFLGAGVPYFSVIETQPRRAGYVEMITTAIDKEHWGDLWRIEFETDDSPGNAALLTNLLIDRGLTVINWESARDSLSERHITSVLVSGTEYESSRDLTCRERMHSNLPRLVELEEDLAIYFWDQLAIDADGQLRLKVKPLHFFRRLHDSIAARRRFIMFGNPKSLNSGRIELSERAVNILRRTLRTEKDSFVAYPTVDTKDRVIRTLITPDSRSSLVHLSATCLATDSRFMKWLYNKLYEIGADIVTAQVRNSSKQKSSAHATSDHYFENSIRVIDLTFHIADQNEDVLTGLMADFRREFAAFFSEDPTAQLLGVKW